MSYSYGYIGPTAGVAEYNETRSHSVSADPKAAARNFFNELSRLLAAYSDPDADLDWMGFHVPAELKYEALGTVIMGEARQTLAQMLEAPFGYYLNPIMQAEKTISDLVGQA